jgi:hypothetical protein
MGLIILPLRHSEMRYYKQKVIKFHHKITVISSEKTGFDATLIEKSMRLSNINKMIYN